MRHYYPFLPWFPHRLNAWKRQEQRVDLTWMGGHRVRFDGIRMAPGSLAMRHHLFLSVEHAVEKYVHSGGYVQGAVEAGWHAWRSRLQAELISLPSEAELRRYVSDQLLDRSEPRTRHAMMDAIAHRSSDPGQDDRDATHDLLPARQQHVVGGGADERAAGGEG